MKRINNLLLRGILSLWSDRAGTSNYVCTLELVQVVNFFIKLIYNSTTFARQGLCRDCLFLSTFSEVKSTKSTSLNYVTKNDATKALESCEQSNIHE